jgi:aspartyl-tRNA synthetase
VSEEFGDPAATFNAFKNIVKAGGVVRAIPAPGAAVQPRSWFDKLNDWARSELRSGGLAYIVFEKVESVGAGHADVCAVAAGGPIVKFLSPDLLIRMAKKAGLRSGDVLFFSAGKEPEVLKAVGAARTRIAEELGLLARDRFELCWIVDFPMYEWNEEEKRIDFSHNPFSMPNIAAEDFLALDAREREKILSLRAIQYDIVCNGVELSSGAIRNHRPDVMRKAFAIAGYDASVLEQKFGGMLRALSLGAPPHGGIAPGIDRIVMLLAGEENLREVVLFPMNQRAQDLMMGAPSEVSARQLRELHIRLSLPDKSG